MVSYRMFPAAQLSVEVPDLGWIVLAGGIALIAAALLITWPRPIFRKVKPSLSESFWSREAESEVGLNSPDSNLGAEILESTHVETVELGPLAKLPPFGPVAISLLRLFDRDDVKLDEIARLVESDPSLASELLAVVNSPMFAFQKEVVSPGHAITLLGMEHTKSLAAALAMRSMVRGAPRTPVVRRFWTHSIATATIARGLAPLFHIDPNLAHVAGIMHDLGRMGLLAAYPTEYTSLALGAHESTSAILAEEQAAVGMTHCHAAGLLAKAWSLPESLREVAEHHHDPSFNQELVSLVQLCCRLADDLMYLAIHRADVCKPEETIDMYAPEGLRIPLKAGLEAANAAVAAAIQTLDF